MTLAYIVVVVVIITGFDQNIGMVNSLLFAGVSAVIGIIISQLLKHQGITWAKELPENKAVLIEYYGTRIKNRKFRDISYYWKRSVIQDIAFKGLGILAFSGGIIYIAIVGSKDYTLLLLAFTNLLMFASFGLLSLTTAYSFFNEQHINKMRQELAEAKEENARREAEEKELTKQAEHDRVFYRYGIADEEVKQ